MTLSIGDKAPAFTLETDTEGTISLKDLKGQKVVLYFYPKDNTPGCTKQAIGFTDELKAFAKAGAKIIGVSKDSLQKHANFRAKQGLKLALGSDPDGIVLEAYGVWVEKKLYGRQYMGIERSTFLIDEKGKIGDIWRKVRVAGHVDKVLDAVKAL
ncbi:MAG: thioredoxin-dependent thiol peroxidase [Parvularculaceae bacterium]